MLYWFVLEYKLFERESDGNKIHETPFDQSKLHSNIGLAPHTCIVLKEVAS